MKTDGNVSNKTENNKCSLCLRLHLCLRQLYKYPSSKRFLLHFLWKNLAYCFSELSFVRQVILQQKQTTNNRIANKMRKNNQSKSISPLTCQQMENSFLIGQIQYEQIANISFFSPLFAGNKVNTQPHLIDSSSHSWFPLIQLSITRLLTLCRNCNTIQMVTLRAKSRHLFGNKGECTKEVNLINGQRFKAKCLQGSR